MRREGMKKREYPKTVFRKKLIKSVFWLGFGLVFFLSIIAVVRVGNATVAKVEEPVVEEEKPENLAASAGAATFAQNFAKQYFSWDLSSAEGRDKRSQALEKYLAEGLDDQAGLAFGDGEENDQWNSKLTGSQVWQIEDTGQNTSIVTLRVEHELSRKVEVEVEVEVEGDDDEDDKTEIEIKEETETSGPHEKYFAIPIKTDGQSFVVYKTPYFVAAPEKPDIEVEEDLMQEGRIVNVELEEEIKAFLETYFKVYTNGTKEELSYYVKGEEIPSLAGIITFEEVREVAIKAENGDFEGNSDSYEVHATVSFTEDQSKIKVIYDFVLTVQKEDDRWFVSDISNF